MTARDGEVWDVFCDDAYGVPTIRITLLVLGKGSEDEDHRHLCLTLASEEESVWPSGEVTTWRVHDFERDGARRLA